MKILELALTKCISETDQNEVKYFFLKILLRNPREDWSQRKETKKEEIHYNGNAFCLFTGRKTSW